MGASGSGEVDVGTPVARVYVAGGAGVFYMGMGDSNLYYPYHYAGVGGGVGFGLEIPVSASVSTPSLPSTGGEWGRLFIAPHRNKASYFPQMEMGDVDQGSIAGPAVLLAPSLSLFGAAGGISVIFFGMDSIPDPHNPISMVNGCNAVAFQAGISLITPGAGVNCTLMNIQIYPNGRITRK